MARLLCRRSASVRELRRHLLISVVPAQLDLDTLGESAQLVTTAVYPNFSRADVTAAAAGTTYVFE